MTDVNDNDLELFWIRTWLHLSVERLRFEGFRNDVEMGENDTEVI